MLREQFKIFLFCVGLVQVFSSVLCRSGLEGSSCLFQNFVSQIDLIDNLAVEVSSIHIGHSLIYVVSYSVACVYVWGAHVCVCICVHVSVCIYMCKYACVYVYMCVHVSFWILMESWVRVYCMVHLCFLC